jgi:tRNA G18 (ribose-2'-O)-methylase SpoU
LAARRRQVTEVWLTEGSDPSPILGEIDRLAREAHVPVRLVSQRRLESVQGTEAPQGVVAFAEPLSAASLAELVLGWSDSYAPEESGLGFNEALDLEDDEDEDVDEDDGFFIELDDLEEGEESVLAVLVDFVEVEADEPDADNETESAAPEASDETESVSPEASDDTEQADTPSDTTGLDGVDLGEDLAIGDELGSGLSGQDDAVTVAAAENATAGVPSKSPASGETPLKAFLVLLEGVTDPQNLGAILRSAECAGATGVAVPRHRSVHVTPAVTKAAAGAIEHLQMALVSGIPSALQALERLGVMTVGLDERGTRSLYDLDLGDRPVALVLGSEGTGLSPLARRRCDVLCRIPVGGEIPSLNVSAAAAVACFEVARQRVARVRA